MLSYATTKGAIYNFIAGLAQLLADKGSRVNAVAPRPIWTPLIPSTLPEDAVADFGSNTPMKRPASHRSSPTALSCWPIRSRATCPVQQSRLPAAARCFEEESIGQGACPS